MNLTSKSHNQVQEIDKTKDGILKYIAIPFCLFFIIRIVISYFPTKLEFISNLFQNYLVHMSLATALMISFIYSEGLRGRTVRCAKVVIGIVIAHFVIFNLLMAN